VWQERSMSEIPNEICGIYALHLQALCRKLPHPKNQNSNLPIRLFRCAAPSI